MPYRHRFRSGQRASWIATALFLGILGLASTAVSCPYCIREAGFIVRDPEPYRLILFVEDDTPQADKAERWLAAAADAYLDESNVRAEVVNLSRQSDHKARKYIEALKINSFPAAILVSPRDEAMSLSLPRPEELSSEALEQLAQGVVASPAREEIARSIISHWCVVLIIAGKDQAENERVGDTVARATKAVTGKSMEMGHKLEQPPPVIRLSSQEPTERILLWSLGLEEGDKSKTRVVILFGMARRLGPILSADEVSRATLVDSFRLLGRNCTCTSDPRWLLGPALPLAWGEDLQVQVLDEMGFDPNNPSVVWALSGAWASLREGDGEGGDGAAPPPTGADYMEFTVEPDAENEDEPGDLGAAPAGTVEQRTARILIRLAIGLVVVAAIGTAALLLRRYR